MEQFYKHKCGGIYRFLCEAINKDNNSTMIVYEHVYPFDKKIYVRNKDDFYDCNVLLTGEQVSFELSKPQQDFQKEISENKNKKKF
jgi:hypothetical protein